MMLAQQKTVTGGCPRSACRAFTHVRPQRCTRLVASASTSTAPASTIEQAALEAYLAAHKPTSVQDCLQTLRQAASSKSVSPELVEGALVYLEQNSKPGPGEAVNPAGTWRLVFGTATKFRPFQYIPIDEDFVIDLAEGRLALESALGPFQFHVKGPVRGWDAATGVLSFQFTAVDIFFAGKKFWQVNPTTKPKTYTWFYQSSNLAAARSSAGGLALMRK